MPQILAPSTWRAYTVENQYSDALHQFLHGTGWTWHLAQGAMVFRNRNPVVELPDVRVRPGARVFLRWVYADLAQPRQERYPHGSPCYWELTGPQPPQPYVPQPQPNADISHEDDRYTVTRRLTVQDPGPYACWHKGEQVQALPGTVYVTYCATVPGPHCPEGPGSGTGWHAQSAVVVASLVLADGSPGDAFTDAYSATEDRYLTAVPRWLDHLLNGYLPDNDPPARP